MAYYKALMFFYDNEGRHEYHAYAEAYDKTEASQTIREELLDDEKEDNIDCITEITEEEFIKEYKDFGDGVRR